MAMEKIEVRIHRRSAVYDAVIPEQYVWEFMAEFGKTFAEESDGVSRNKAVDGYVEYPCGWHIQVKVEDEDEMKFYNFLRDFSQQRNLPFREYWRKLYAILQPLRDLQEKANQVPVPDLSQILPSEGSVKELVEIAQHLLFLHQNYKSHRLTGKYQGQKL
jgi:hypothetical protein